MAAGPDPGGDAMFDAPALLRRLGLDRPFAGRVVGEMGTGGVASLPQRGTVRLGLVLAADAVAARSTKCFDVPDTDYDHMHFAVACNRHATSRTTAGFLVSAPAGSIVAQGGLEIVA